MSEHITALRERWGVIHRTCEQYAQNNDDTHVAKLRREQRALEAAIAALSGGGAVSADSAPIPLVQQTAPERIWLAVADDTYYADQPFPNDLEEVCWSHDAPLEVCVPYIRADLVSATAT